MSYKQNKKSCPYCQYKDTIENFINWQRGKERGLLGKTPEGFIMILCPQCRNHIKYDPLGNTFLKENQQAKSTSIFNLIFAGIVLLILYFLVKVIF